MLGKLIKYDFKAISRTLLPLLLGVFGATILACISMKVNMSLPDYGDTSQVIRAITGLVSGLMLFAIIASIFICVIVIFQRYYRNFMKDEAYLTFTLPVTSTQHLWSKLITAFIWEIICTIAIIVCALIFAVFGTSPDSFMNTAVINGIGQGFSGLFGLLGGQGILYALEVIALMLVGSVFGIMQIFLAMTIGGMLAKKHKGLAAVGFYFAINIVVSIISTAITSIIAMRTSEVIVDSFDFATGNALESAGSVVARVVHPMLISYIVMFAVFSVGMFILCRYFLKNKLNVE